MEKKFENIKTFEEFKFEKPEKGEDLLIKGDSLVGWYNAFGRILCAIPTLGTSILAENGIDYLKEMYKKHKYLKNIIDKLSEDEMIMNFHGNIDNDREVQRRIRELLTDREREYLYDHVDKVGRIFGFH